MQLSSEQIAKAKSQLDTLEDQTKKDWIAPGLPDGAYVIYTVDEDGHD